MKDPKAALRSIDLFADLDPDQIALVAEKGQAAIYRQGDTILQKGEQSTEIYVVLEGQVEVVSAYSDAHQSLVILGAGQSFGEMSLLDAGPRSATIRCVSPEAHIMIFTRAALLSLWEQAPTIGYQMMLNIARDLAFKLRISHLTQEVRAAEAGGTQQ